MQGLVFAHLFVLAFFCVKAVSSTSFRNEPRDVVITNSSMRISTYNLRFDSMPDNITVQQSIAALGNPLVQPQFFGISGEQPWSTRRIKVAQRLLSEGGIIASEYPCPTYVISI
jgi:hypothetical protein